MDALIYHSSDYTITHPQRKVTEQKSLSLRTQKPTTSQKSTPEEDD
jgi:hypothetical protein